VGFCASKLDASGHPQLGGGDSAPTEAMYAASALTLIAPNDMPQTNSQSQRLPTITRRQSESCVQDWSKLAAEMSGQAGLALASALAPLSGEEEEEEESVSPPQPPTWASARTARKPSGATKNERLE
jgi:hypothetical protein